MRRLPFFRGDFRLPCEGEGGGLDFLEREGGGGDGGGEGLGVLAIKVPATQDVAHATVSVSWRVVFRPTSLYTNACRELGP